jgi:hypothetical protein
VQTMILNAREEDSTDVQRFVSCSSPAGALKSAAILAATLLCVIGISSAQNSASSALASSNVFAGYSFIADNLFSGQHSDMNGWHVSAEKKYLPFFGIVGDMSGLYGSINGTCSSSYQGQCLTHAKVSEYTFQAGIRGSYAAAAVRPFAEALFGAARTAESGSGQSNSNLGFAATLGAGLDGRLTRVLACRFVVDYIVTGNFANARQNSLRVSSGLVIHF